MLFGGQTVERQPLGCIIYLEGDLVVGGREAQNGFQEADVSVAGKGALFV